ncbi:MAG: cation transporter [Rhodocyclaceae bacterium]|nr:cation transporter [Rhodocyclaceae bacterium]
MSSSNLTRYAWLSIAAALATIALKGWAWHLTGSVGLLSDAIESFVNLAGAIMALAMLTVAAWPADDGHAHGHGKAEYFSSAFEGLLIFAAALSIIWAAINRLRDPQPLESVGVGLIVSALASLINLGVARVLLSAGREFHSITLEADAHHLMTDVWTSAGVIVGVGLVMLTGWWWLDPVIAIAVAGNILFTGWMLMQRSADGLMDASLPAGQVARIEELLDVYRADGFGFHALRTRQAGRRAFITLHLLVPGDWTVKQGHDLAEKLEEELRSLVPNLHATLHVEPIDDPASMADEALDRGP